VISPESNTLKDGSMNSYEEEYKILTAMANAKMVMNAHKGNIEDMDISEMVRLAMGELEELEQAAKSSTHHTHIVEEAADVLNFLVAIVSKTVTGYRAREKTSVEIIQEFTD
jgi:hypothetical protein